MTLCGRKKEKAQSIVDELLAGKGYQKKVEGDLAGQGDYCVPPCDAGNWKLKAGDNATAAEADIIVFGECLLSAVFWSPAPPHQGPCGTG